MPLGLERATLANAAHRLAEFAGSRSAGAPPAEIGALVNSIGGQADIDGVVVQHGSVTVATWLD